MRFVDGTLSKAAFAPWMLALGLLCTLSACGGSGESPAVVRLGSDRITRADLARQMSAVAPEHVVPDPPLYTQCVAHLKRQTPEAIGSQFIEECLGQYQALKQRGLGRLISSQWLVGEAAAWGLQMQGGSLTTKAKVAEQSLRRMLMSREPPIAQARAVAYYTRNLGHFERPERRYIDIVERIPTRAAATRRLHEVIRGGDLARVAIHEVFDKEDTADVVPWKRTILKEIFAAKPHVLIGPVPLNKRWCFFEVTGVVPRVVKTLAQVQDAIQRQLAGEQQRRTLARFIGAWRRKWIARTDCSAGYVVQKCRQYRGPKTPEDPLAFN